MFYNYPFAVICDSLQYFPLGLKPFAFFPLLKTRSLLSVFEEDAGTLTDYTNQLLQAMQRVYGAQVIFH